MATWQAAGQEKLGGNPVGTSVDPKLVNPGGGGITNGYNPGNLTAYHLQGGSPMVLSGLNMVTNFSIDPGIKDYYGTSVTTSTLPIGAAAN